MAKLSAMAAKKREKKKLLMEQGVATDRSAKKMDHGQNKQVSARDSDGSGAGKQSQKKQSELHSEQRIDVKQGASGGGNLECKKPMQQDGNNGTTLQKKLRPSLRKLRIAGGSKEGAAKRQHETAGEGGDEQHKAKKSRVEQSRA